MIEDPEFRHFMLKQALESIDSAVARFVRAHTIQFGQAKIICVSNPSMPSDTALFYCGPGPKQHVWVTGLGDQPPPESV